MNRQVLLTKSFKLFLNVHVVSKITTHCIESRDICEVIIQLVTRKAYKIKRGLLVSNQSKPIIYLLGFHTAIFHYIVESSHFLDTGQQ